MKAQHEDSKAILPSSSYSAKSCSFGQFPKPPVDPFLPASQNVAGERAAGCSLSEAGDCSGCQAQDWPYSAGEWIPSPQVDRAWQHYHQRNESRHSFVGSPLQWG